MKKEENDKLSIFNDIDIKGKTILLFDDVDLMVEYVRKKDDEVGLSKTVAGFSWKWNTKPGKRPEDNMDYYDFLVENGKYDIIFRL